MKTNLTKDNSFVISCGLDVSREEIPDLLSRAVAGISTHLIEKGFSPYDYTFDMRPVYNDYGFTTIQVRVFPRQKGLGEVFQY